MRRQAQAEAEAEARSAVILSASTGDDGQVHFRSAARLDLEHSSRKIID